MAAVVTTSATSYAKVSVIVVKYTGLPGNATDWIAIAHSGDPATTYNAWVYTGGAVDGYAFFIAPNGGPHPTVPITPDTDYVARAFENDTTTLLDESPTFEVRDGVAADLIYDVPPPNASSEYSVEQRLALPGDYITRNVGSSNYSFCTCEAAAPTIHTESITPSIGQLIVTFNQDLQLSGPALDLESWYVTHDDDPDAHDVRLTSMVVGVDSVTFTTTPQTDGGLYRLHLPNWGITSPAFGIFTGDYSLDFVGVPTPVTVQMVKVVDVHRIDVIFAIAVDETDASDPTNYQIDNGLTCVSATKITDHWYRLRNEPRQVDATTYTITISNIAAK